MTARGKAFVSIAAALRGLAGGLEQLAQAELAQAERHERSPNEYLDLERCKLEFGAGRASILGGIRSGELVAVRGPRGKYLVLRASLERWRASRPVEAETITERPHRTASAPAASAANDPVDPIDEWEARERARIGIGARR